MSTLSYKENTRNQQNALYRALTRLFSGPITKRRRQFYRKERRIDMQKYNFKSATGAPFKKLTNDMFLNMSTRYLFEQRRAERYSDFDMMVYEPILGSALDIYADEITTSNEFQKLLTISCRNQEIKSILDQFYYNILNIESNLYYWVRTMCKYGDFFLYLDIDEDKGVINVIGLPTREVERIEGQDKSNPNYIQFQWNTAGLTFENWQIAHFRILGDDKYAPYGLSVFENSRRSFRQYDLLKQAMMSYRVVRSAERRVFYLDVGNIAPDDVEQYVLGFQKELKKNQIIDVESGKVDLRYNPLSVEEDYIIPVRGETGTRIDTLPGGQYTGDVDDVKFLRDEMLAALKVPASYLLPDEGGGGGEDRSTLAQKDIRFARTIQRIQRHVVSELEKIGQIHLYTLGFRGDDIIDFKLKLANPSKIAALQELEHWRTKFDVASAATEGYFSKRWVAINFFGLSEEEFIRNQREIYNDKKFEAMLEASMHMEVGAKGMFGPEGGGPIGDMGEMGDLEGGGEPLDQELTLPPSENQPEADENDTLLAQPEEPAKRDDGSKKVKVKKSLFGKDLTTTDNSKGKLYKPETFDKRKTSGARKQQMNNLSGLYPSRRSADSQKDIRRLGRGVFEDSGNYIKEEKEIDNIEQSLNKITEELDSESKTQ